MAGELVAICAEPGDGSKPRGKRARKFPPGGAPAAVTTWRAARIADEGAHFDAAFEV